jgi:hypothetical protein
MIKVFTAITEEIDFPQDAAAELKEQIRPEENLLANSVGILHCHPDFFAEDMLRTLHDAFGFPILGSATAGVSGQGQGVSLGLELTVLTSDNARFSAAASGGEITGENCDEKIAELYAALTAGSTEKPVLLMPYIPYYVNVASDRILTALEKTTENIPTFGSMAVSLINAQYEKSYALFNHEILTDRIAMLAIFSDKKPRFYTTTVGNDKTIPLRDFVTETDGRLLISIGNKKYKDYMTENKLPLSGSVPFLFYYADGTVVSRVCIDITPEGYGIFAGEVPVNTEVALCTLTSVDNIIKEVEEFMEGIKKKEPDMSGCLIYSCVYRMILLGVEKIKEITAIQQNLAGKPFGFAYSGGEIFPQSFEDGRTVNRVQNTSLTVCIL